MKKIELLSPAGDFESLKSAVNAGADAVYLGGKKFGARAFSKNFDNEEMIEAINYAHLYGVKVYVTINTIIYENEIDEVIEYIDFHAYHTGEFEDSTAVLQGRGLWPGSREVACSTYRGSSRVRGWCYHWMYSVCRPYSW